MSVFRALGNLFGKQDAPTASAPQSEDGQLRPRRIYEITFDNGDTTESSLLRLWRVVEESDPEDSRAAMAAFFGAFIAAYQGWVPTEPGADRSPGAPPGRWRTTAANPRSGPGPDGGPLGTLVGCSAGHPTAILNAMLRSLEGLPAALGSVSHGPGGGPLGDRGALLGHWLAPLWALQIAARSANNRAVLLQLRAPAFLHNLLKGIVARATGAVATFQVAGGTPTEDLRLPLLGALLAGTAGALRSLIEGELDLVVRSTAVPGGTGSPTGVPRVSPRLLDPPGGLPEASESGFTASDCASEPLARVLDPCSAVAVPPLTALLGGSPLYCLDTAWEPCNKGQADAMERVLKPYLDEGFAERLLEGLRAALGLRAVGAPLEPAHLASLLSALLLLLSPAPSALPLLLSPDRGHCGLAMILEELGNVDLNDTTERDDATVTPPAVTGDAAVLQLRVQYLSLQLVVAATKRSKKGLQLFHDMGGAARVTRLIQWSALNFGSIVVPHQTGGHTRPEQSADGRVGSSGGGFESPGCRPLEELFAVLELWLLPAPELGRTRSGATFGIGGKGASQRNHWVRLCREVLGVAVGALRPEAPAGLSQGQEIMHAAAVGKLSAVPGPLQHCFLGLLTQVLRVDSSIGSLLRDLGVWDLVYGPAFFFAGASPNRMLASFHLEEDFLDRTGPAGPAHVPAGPIASPITGRALSPIMGGAASGGIPAQGTPSRVPPGVPKDQGLKAGPAGLPDEATTLVALPDQARTQPALSNEVGVPKHDGSGGGRASRELTLGTAREHVREEASEAEEEVPGRPGQAPPGEKPKHGLPGVLPEMVPEAVDEVPSHRQRALAELRRRIVGFTEFAAAVPNGGGPRPEVHKLLELLDNHTKDPEMVQLAAPALTRLAAVMPDQAMANLDNEAGLEALARIILSQYEQEQSQKQRRSMEQQSISPVPHVAHEPATCNEQYSIGPQGIDAEGAGRNEWSRRSVDAENMEQPQRGVGGVRTSDVASPAEDKESDHEGWSPDGIRSDEGTGAVTIRKPVEQATSCDAHMVDDHGTRVDYVNPGRTDCAAEGPSASSVGTPARCSPGSSCGSAPAGGCRSPAVAVHPPYRLAELAPAGRPPFPHLGPDRVFSRHAPGTGADGHPGRHRRGAAGKGGLVHEVRRGAPAGSGAGGPTGRYPAGAPACVRASRGHAGGCRR
eukprot:jgi/Botrbrau1/20838/Bobra.0156s0063.1